ncbi:carboxypeptidase family protein [Edaphobacter aggregans]|uniref:Carboxypeptidase family protein n=1 Tax=Edaphobacter aggregans TaxID=570835 RepID=A0A428MQG8_9BACT|nr:TonB-dependent receptor [Edaphobacter aggregans]RSL19151.1 carboxypeptidase family protein [Edaphobacter aggregans]
MYEDAVTQSGISHGRLFQQTHRVSVKALRRSVWAFVVPLVAIAMLLTAPAYAQTLYGTLVGNVTDSTGAAVVGAMVVATDTGTGIAKTVTTDGSGTFRLSDLAAGTYKVSITAKAFASTVGQGIEIQANTERRFDVQLHPATVGQTVMVTAAPPELQTDTANVTSELETTQVQTLVTTAGLNMRNFQSLFVLLPGFSPPGEQHSEAGNPADTMMFNANGVSGSNNSTRIDGVSDIYAWLPEITAYTPSTEAISAVNVVTNSMNAEQGFASGASVNVTTKSGTNRFHGSAWEYNMISALMAKSFFFTPTATNRGLIPKYILNQFGANYGGPIMKNKAFFFGNWERTRRSQALSGFQTVPTSNMLTGNFTGISTVIYDPATGNANGTGRTPFPNNVIPASRISYAAQQMIKLMTADTPNVTGAGLSNNFFGAADGEYTRDNVDTRIDYTPSNKSTVFGRYGFQKANLFDPQTLGTAGGTTFDGGQPGNAPSLVQSIGIGGTYAFRSNLLLDANVGYLRQGMAAKNTDIGTDWGTSYFNIPGTNGSCSLCGGMPRFVFSGGLSNLGNQNNSNPFQFRDNTYVTAANLSWNKGKHSTRYGMEFDRFAINHFQPQNTSGPRGGFNFTGGLTTLTGGAAANGYNSWADFLLGLPQLVQKDTQYLNPATSRESVWAFYAQDQWRATEKLTVNYGIRYEYYPIATRDHSGLDIFNPADGNLYVEGSAGVPASVKVQAGKGMFAPRLGLAYRIDSKTVARAGFGLSTNPDSFRNVLTTYPSVVSQTIQGNTANVSPVVAGVPVTLTTGIPILTAPTLSPSSPSVALGSLGSPAGSLGATTLPLNYRRGYYESYNAALERELPGAIILNATYVGEHIIREVPGININANLAPGQTVAQEPMNALYGITAGITSEIPDGTGHYNALQAQAKHRFAGDSSVAVNYTYSRAINDYGDQSDGESGLFTAMGGPYWRLNRGVAGFDRTHNLQIFGNYMLPFGRGQAFLQTGPAAFILGGWSLSGSLSRESGTPFTVTGSGGSLGPSTSGSSQFADVISKSNMILGGHDSTHPYFNPANFADPSVAEKAASGSSCSAANTAVCRFGTAGLHSLRGPGLTNLSTSVARTFTISDRYSMIFRAEAFNLTNTPQFSNPASSVTASSGFGVISGVTSNSNRELRFSGRINF